MATATKPKISALAQWYGSNRMLAEHVGKELEGCSWVGIPFAGGMCEAAHINARTLAINDQHLHVINMASVAADQRLGPKLYRQLRRTAFHPEELQRAQENCRAREALQRDREAITDNPLFDRLQWAVDYFVSAWMSRAGLAGTKKEFDAPLSTRWDAGGGDSCKRFRNAASGLIEWRRILSRANFTAMDGFDFIAKVKDAEGHGLYADAPFPGPGDKYKHTFDEGGQRRLAEAVSGFERTRVVMRFYDHPLIRELYPDSKWTWVCREGRTQTNGSAPEVLLINGPSKQ